ncbi:MAG: hypothetical protein ISP24_04395 [Rickettsiales bacterium]|nr:hypothetical protein [Rickettsiales bacterium]
MRYLIIIFSLIIILQSCSRYKGGAIYALNNYRGNDYYSFFNYNIIKKGNVIVHARIAGTDYYGNAINIRSNNGDKRKFSVIRMQNLDGSLIQCFNELNKATNFAKGGKGICYEDGERLFDIIIQPSNSYMSINFLRNFLR